MSTARTKLATYWDDLMFRPIDPLRLGVCRFLYYLGLYWVLFVRPGSILNPNYIAASELPHEFYFPQNIWRYIPIAGTDGLVQLTVVFKIVLLLAAVGLLTRITTVVAFLLMFYLMSVPQQFGRIVMIMSIPTMTMFLLAWARSGDAFSLDRLLKDRFPRWPLTSAVPTPSGAYQWPIQAVCFYLTMTFCLAGINKLLTSGLAWALSDNLSTLLRTTLKEQSCVPRATPGQFPELTFWLADQKLLCKILATSVLVIELFAPVVMFLKGLPRAFMVLSMLGSTLSFYIFVGADAQSIALVILFFIPWDRVVRWRPGKAT